MLIDKLNGNENDLKALSNMMYCMTKDASRESFKEYKEDCGVSEEAWNIFKTFLRDNGLDTYI